MIGDIQNTQAFLHSRRLLSAIWPDFEAASRPTPELQALISEHSINEKIVFADHVLTVAKCRCAHSITPRFEFSNEGQPCTVMTVPTENLESTCDLVAWPLPKPWDFRVAVDEAEILGAQHLRSAASYVDGPLPIWRSPIEYLKADCHGVVLLKQRGSRWLPFAHGPLEARDTQHVAEIHALVGLWAETPRRPAILSARSIAA